MDGSSLCLKDFLSHKIAAEPGILGVVISDNVGVSVAQEWSSSGKELQNRLKSGSEIIAAYPTTSEHASKLGLGSSEVVIACYAKYQIIQFNKLQNHNLVITLFTKMDCNTGLILEKANEWEATAAAVNRQVLADIPQVTV